MALPGVRTPLLALLNDSWTKTGRDGDVINDEPLPPDTALYSQMLRTEQGGALSIGNETFRPSCLYHCAATHWYSDRPDILLEQRSRCTNIRSTIFFLPPARCTRSPLQRFMGATIEPDINHGDGRPYSRTANRLGQAFAVGGRWANSRKPFR